MALSSIEEVVIVGRAEERGLEDNDEVVDVHHVSPRVLCNVLEVECERLDEVSVLHREFSEDALDVLHRVSGVPLIVEFVCEEGVREFAEPELEEVGRYKDVLYLELFSRVDAAAGLVDGELPCAEAVDALCVDPVVELDEGHELLEEVRDEAPLLCRPGHDLLEADAVELGLGPLALSVHEDAQPHRYARLVEQRHCEVRLSPGDSDGVACLRVWRHFEACDGELEEAVECAPATSLALTTAAAAATTTTGATRGTVHVRERKCCRVCDSVAFCNDEVVVEEEEVVGDDIL